MSLPGDTGLEKEIARLGVVSSQVDLARQAFMRSANKAGFFWGGRSRLVHPPATSLNSTTKGTDSPPPPPPLPPGKDDVWSNALLAALFKKMLPDEDQEFSAKERKRFSRALAVNLDVIYGEPSDGEIDPETLAALFKDKPTAYATPTPA